MRLATGGGVKPDGVSSRRNVRIGAGGPGVRALPNREPDDCKGDGGAP